LIKYTHRKANGNKLRSSSKKEQMTLFRVHFGLLRLGIAIVLNYVQHIFSGGWNLSRGLSPLRPISYGTDDAYLL